MVLENLTMVDGIACEMYILNSFMALDEVGIGYLQALSFSVHMRSVTISAFFLVLMVDMINNK